MEKLILKGPADVLPGDVYMVECCGSNMHVFKHEFYRVVENQGRQLLSVKVKLNKAKNGFIKTQCKPIFAMNLESPKGKKVWRY